MTKIIPLDCWNRLPSWRRFVLLAFGVRPQPPKAKSRWGTR